VLKLNAFWSEKREEIIEMGVGLSLVAQVA
jgi:hypothetical protein